MHAGRSLEEIGDYVGHSSAYMTDRYRHQLDGQRAEAAEALGAFLSRSTGARTGAQSVSAEWLSGWRPASHARVAGSIPAAPTMRFTGNPLLQQVSTS
jgi:hypothetical protein